MAKLRAILDGVRIAALGEHSDKISVPVPDEITFNNFDRMELINDKTPEDIKSWKYVPKTQQEKEEEVAQILEKTYTEIAIVTETTIDEAHDFVKDDLVDKGKVDTKK